MKKVTLIALVSLLSVSFAFAQGSRIFLKRIENNYAYGNAFVPIDGKRRAGDYNIESKKGVEKLFFGDFNAKIEYFLEPSFVGASGFRIYRDSKARYILEVKSIPNFREVENVLDKEFPYHNRELRAKRSTERLKLYQIVTKSVPINDALAEKLYDKTVTAIDTYKSVGKLQLILDGEMVTFRTVVGEDVWTFTIHQPVGYIEKLSNLFKQIITDVDTENFDESKYIKLLEN